MLNPIQNKYISQRNIIGSETPNTGVLLGSQNSINASNLSQLSCQYVTLSNYDLNGTETVDGSSPSDGDLILVANQTDKSENGVYQYSTSGDWDRQTGIKGGQLITITDGATKEGTLWVVETTTFTEGVDDIDIIEQSLTRKAGDFAGFSTFSLTTSDILLAEDVSNSNAKGKVTINDIVSLAGGNTLSNVGGANELVKALSGGNYPIRTLQAGTDISITQTANTIVINSTASGSSQLDTAQYTFYVSPNFTQTGHFYNDLEDALDDATLTATPHTIIVLKGTYTGNFAVGSNYVYCAPEVEIKTTNKAFPVITVGTSGKWLGDADIVDNPTSGYAVELDDDTVFEFNTCIEDDNAIEITAINSGDVYIRGNRVGKVYTASHELRTYIDVETITEIEWSDFGECYIECKEFEELATVTSGRVQIEAQRYLADNVRLFSVSGGTLIASGRLEDFDDVQNTTTGAGFPILHTGGTIQLNNFFAYNARGGIIFGASGTLKTANTTLQAGTDGIGGTADTIYSPVFGTYPVLYNNSTSLNSNPHANVVEVATGNKVQNASITI